MAFDVAADSYDRFMGRYSIHLSAQLARFAGVKDGLRVLDVGCGPGALTAHLCQCVGADNVAAVDPSPPFVEAARERLPKVDVRLAPAEELPFEDGEFDVALAQLVVHFMSDPVAGLREMARVSRGVVAACVWDLAGDRAPLSTFWQAATSLDPDARGEGELAGAREGHLAELMREAGLQDVVETELTASTWYQSFDEWWEPYLGGVGPAGVYAVSLDDEQREALKEACRERLPEPPFDVVAVAGAARGRV